MYKVCIFDLDGTLADTVESIAYSGNRSLQALGFEPLSVERYKEFAGDGAAELIRRCLRASGDTGLNNFERMSVVYRTFFAEACMYHVKPYDGIPEVLEGLKNRGSHIAVLSNKPHDQAVDVVEALFGAGYFDYIQGQAQGMKRKPDPDGAFRIADYFRSDPGECMYVGDTDTDMQTGKGAGMFTVGVLWGFRSRQELADNHADRIIEMPLQLLELI